MRHVELRFVCVCVFALFFALVGPVVASDASEDDGPKSVDEELTLERLFPEKSVFGPGAGQMSFTHDGRYGAYLYRPRIERRHGNDLWLYDTETGETRRLTKVSVMSEFQRSTRAVRDDRIKKAGAAGGGGSKSESDGDDAAAAGDDPVSGTWEGRVRGGEEQGIADGTFMTLEIRLSADGVLSGMLHSEQGEADIEEGTFDAETGALRCVLRVRDADFTAVLEATIEDDVMTGVLAMDAVGARLEFEAERVAADEATDDTEDAISDEQGEGEDGEDGDGEEEEEKEEEIDLGDVVTESDAEDDKAPRYGGVQTYTWSPTAHELIFVSAGDLYRYEIEDDRVTRLTRTRENERDVQYLPDGSGYTYLRDGALLRVRFDSSLIEQLDPRLPGGQSMSSYRISPDQTRLVFLANEGESYWNRGQRVNIVNYRDRFAQVRTVTRHMSDDPIPEYKTHVYLHDLRENFAEEGEPKLVYTHVQSGPRDTMPVPAWAPDSSRVSFAVFEQDSGHVHIMESRFIEDEADVDTDASDDADTDESEVEEAEEADEPTYEIEEARAIYRFLHNGGPNTPYMIEPRYLSDSRRLAFITELSGFRHLHVLDPLYEHLEPLTQGRFEVYVIDISPDHERMFVLATKDDPTQQQVYAVDLSSGGMERLSPESGFYEAAAVSPDGRFVLANHRDDGRLRELVAIDVAAGEQTNLTDSHTAEARAITEPTPEFFTYENRNGQTIHGFMFKPDDWTEADERPLLIYVYGGPLGTRKMVTRGTLQSSAYFFAYYMAKKHGYVTCTIDPRGASGYGAVFEKSNFEQVGQPQVDDLVDGVRHMIEHHGVDEDRIGIHGWSFGGFQTQMCLYTEPDVFHVGIAGAGPTEWENYNSWYSTGTIGPSRTGRTDLEAFSLLPLAKNLEGRLLLVHGMEDANVLYQDTVRVYRALLQAGKEVLVDLFLDPTGGHGLGGDVKILNRFRKYEDYLLLHLGSGASATGDDEAGQPAESTSGDEDASESSESMLDRARDVWERLKMKRDDG